MIYKFIRLILKNKKLVAFLRRAYSDANIKNAAETTIVEAEPLHCRKSNIKLKRLNLLVPALSTKHVFGGISTALSFFEVLGRDYENLRIVITEEKYFEHKDNLAFKNWKICDLDAPDGPGHRIICASNRFNKTLSVSEEDKFIATAWWTAVIAKKIQSWQCNVYSKMTYATKFIYLIQDYEPGFYPWSSRYALAESTYHDAKNFIAVFNSSFLKIYFDYEKYQFPQSFMFEPVLNHDLKIALKKCYGMKKEKRVIIYGRPSVERNAFQIIVMALRLWTANNPGSGWLFVAAGEVFPPVALGDGKFLNSIGKLTIAEYANELSKASVGISLMVSPHPSYPPLEMAAFGVKTITNHYKNKDLSVLNSNIISVDKVDAETIEVALNSLIVDLENSNSITKDLISSPNWVNFLESESNLDQICSNIRAEFDLI